MKTIGLIGGLSWESSAGYYRLLNEGVRARLGGLHSASVVMVSVDFAPVEAMQRADDWQAAGAALADAARRVEAAGADFLLIGANTMHLVADAVEDAVSIPLLHIADAAGERARSHGWRRVGLLGTRFTMERDFYRARLAERFGLEVLVPGAADRELVDRVIYEELCLGKLRDASRREYARIIGELAEAGAEAVILGCTEIGLLVGPDDAAVPLLDTAAVHAEAAVARALADER